MKTKRSVVLRVLVIWCVLSIFVLCSCTSESEQEYNVPVDAMVLDITVSEVYGDADAIVTIISDDGYYATAENLDRIFGERGLKCTVAGAIKNVKPYTSSWKELLENDSIDLVSHSYNHIRMEDGSDIAQNNRALTHEIVDEDKWFERKFGHEQIVFVCPENQMCENGYKILNENDFWAVRRGHRGFNSLSPDEGIEYGNWFNLMVQGICDDGVDIDVRNGWVDTAIYDKVWLIEMWHNVMPEDDGGYQTILLSDAEEHLDYILYKSNENAIWVATFDETVKYIREKQNVNVSAYIYGDELHVYAELTNNEMNIKTFNQPLTVHISIPDELGIDKVGGFDLVDGELVIDVVPGVEQVIRIG